MKPWEVLLMSDERQYDQLTHEILEGWREVLKNVSLAEMSDQEQERFNEARTLEELAQKRNFTLGGKMLNI